MSPFLGTRGAGSSKAFDPGAGRPNQVTGLTATDFGTSRAFNDGRIDLSWTAPANNGAPITGYRIERSTDGSSYSTLVANTGSSATTYSNTGLNSAQIYYYRVAAINAVGTGINSSAANATSTTVPQAPTIGTPTCATGQPFTGSANISVPFTANATGGKSITSYTVTPSAGGGTGTGASSPIVISRTVGTSYTFTVTATNANGTSSSSAASASVLSASVPQAPTIGTATAGTESASITFTGNATGGSAITTYTMTSNPGSITGTGGTSPITVSNLTAGTAYTFTVTATNAFGTSTASAASNSVTPIAPYFVGMAYSTDDTQSEFRRGWDTSKVDSSGNIYIAGTNYQNVSGSRFRFSYLAKLNPSGVVQWQKNITGDVNENTTSYINRIYRIDVSSAGNIYVTGGVKNSAGNGEAIFLAKFDTSGNLSWYRRFISQNGGTNANEFNINTVVLDSSENVYMSVTGNVSGVGQNFCNIFKFNSSGTELWKRQIQNNYSDNGSRIYVPAITVNSSGDVFVAGTSNLFSSSFTMFVMKFNSSGAEQWKRTITPPSGTTPSFQEFEFNAAGLDSTGNLYLAGQWKNSSGGFPGILLKYDTNGTLQWQREITNTGVTADFVRNKVRDMAIDSSNNIWLVGNHRDSNNIFGSYIAKYDTNGTLSGSWNFRQSTYTTDEGYQVGLGIDSSSNLYITGSGFAKSSGQPPFYAISYAKLPNNGTKSGTYTVVNGGGFVWATTNPMTSSNSSGSTGTPTDISSTTGTTTTSTTPALSVSNANLTFAKVNI